jgi:hypothetical protein
MVWKFIVYNFQLAALPETALEGATTLYKDQIIACTGMNNHCWKYIIATDSWVQFPPMKFTHWRMPGLETFFQSQIYQ